MRYARSGALAAVVALLTACGAEPAPRGRVLLVGIDGATLRVAQPLMERGRLPNLARIAKRGASGRLRAHFPLKSARIWASIATGKSPEKHGILDFAHEDEQGVKRLYMSFDRRAHALWNIASDAGLDVGVVNWWGTYPLEKVRGVMISDHLLPLEILGRRALTGAVEPATGPIVYPPEWEERVQTLLDRDDPLTAIEDPFTDAAVFAGAATRHSLSARYRNDQAVTRIALAVERGIHPDLLMVYLSGIDRVSHFLWGAIEPPSLYRNPPQMSPELRAARARALHLYYAYTDALIGRLVERYAADDLVMVVSDHGFEAGSRLPFLTGVHASPRALHGVVFARGRGIEPGSDVGEMSVHDVAPTVLAWLGLAVADDMDGHVAAFLHGSEPAHVASYDTRPIERLRSAPSGAEPEILEQLQSLGYFEHGPDEE